MQARFKIQYPMKNHIDKYKMRTRYFQPEKCLWRPFTFSFQDGVSKSCNNTSAAEY